MRYVNIVDFDYIAEVILIVCQENHRCIYENEDVLIEYFIAKLANGTREVVLWSFLKKDGKLWKGENGSTLISDNLLFEPLRNRYKQLKHEKQKPLPTLKGTSAPIFFWLRFWKTNAKQIIVNKFSNKLNLFIVSAD